MSAPPRVLPLLAGLVILFIPVLLLGQATGAPKRVLVEVNTTMGRMVIALNNETPKHRDNFLALVREHYYDSTLFHRVVPGAMIIGGDPASRLADDRHRALGNGSMIPSLPPEIDHAHVHVKGALGAIRDESLPQDQKRSHGSGFYIILGQDWTPSELRMVEMKRTTADPTSAFTYTPDQVRAYATDGGSPRMDGEYTVFGQVLEGSDVLDRIAASPCDDRDRPFTDVRVWMRILP
ncbi:MAG: peptidylprolyl isomerase [Flavobacteriales bacterium]|nr:peptidylprolyl isomerase [Flavobacteriales bacterium]